MYDKDTIRETKIRQLIYGLNEHIFENKGVTNRGDTCTTDVIPALSGKHKQRVTLETNTNPVEEAAIREHGSLMDPISHWGPSQTVLSV